MCVNRGNKNTFAVHLVKTIFGASNLERRQKKTPEIKSPEPAPLPEQPKPPTEKPVETKETQERARTSIKEDRKKQLALKGRRYTILTGEAGLTEPATVKKKTLLGG